MTLVVAYTIVLFAFVLLWVLTMNKAVGALHAADPALYHAAVKEVMHRRFRSRFAVRFRLLGWLRKHRNHRDVRRYPAVRNWLRAHYAALAGLFSFAAGFLLVLILHG